MNRREAVAPPRLAAWLVAKLLPAEARDAVLGDLHERFSARLEARGRAAARRWYWRQVGAFAWRTPSGAGLGADIRFAARSLRRRPGLTVTATLVLALAIGANATVFSVVKAVLIERLPFPEPERLVMLWDVYPPEERSDGELPITLEHVRAWAAQPDLFSAVGAYESTSPALDFGDWRERVDAAYVTASLLPLLGATPHLGRLFVEEDQHAGAAPVVVLSHGLWASRYGADAGIVGRDIDVNGRQARVIGVTGPEFWFYDPYAATRSITGRHAESARLWLPLPDDFMGGETDYPRYRVIARLADGVHVDVAAESAAAIRRGLPPTSISANGQLRMLVLADQVLGEARPRLLGLAGAVSLVLLIACVNLVSLLLVHLESRRSELAVRTALGAGRWRLTRQLVVESTMLALCGGAVGLLAAVAGTRVLLDLVPRGLPLSHRVGPDLGVAWFGIGVAVLAGLAIGLIAAFQLDSRKLSPTMAAGARAVAGTRSQRRLHAGLLGTEVALSVVLLITATLLVRSLVGLQTTDTGFDARGVLTFFAQLESAPDGERDDGFFVAFEERLKALPGVAAVGGTSALPFSRWGRSAAVSTPSGETQRVEHRSVSPDYFAAVGQPILAGRAFEPGDREGTAPVAVVSEAFARAWFGAPANAVDRVIEVRLGRDPTTTTVVGVVADVKHSRIFEATRPVLYEPIRQNPTIFQRYVVRVATGSPMALVEPVRRAAAGLNPNQSLGEFIAFEDLVGQSIEEERFYALVLGAFAALAVILTLVGIYGVVSYATRQRDREVGIRLALGARTRGVRWLIVRQALAPVMVGIGLGIGGALAAGRLLRGLLHDVGATDPASFAAATMLFAAVATIACLMPARRASRVDPVQVLRGE